MFKRIGIVWFQGEQNLHQKKFIENIYNWRILNPEWEVVVVDNEMLRTICKNYSDECLNVYDSFDIMHLKIDFGRYVALWDTFTMYIDMDCYAFRSLDDSTIFNEFIEKSYKHKHLLGVSSINTNFFEKWISNIYINNAIMISTPKNPMIKSLIDSIITKNIKNTNHSLLICNQINETTGPSMLSRFIDHVRLNMNQYPDSDLHIFPFYVFEPGQHFQPFDIRDDTIAIHKYELSWLSEEMRWIVKTYYDIKPYFLIILFLLICIVCIKSIKIQNTKYKDKDKNNIKIKYINT